MKYLALLRGINVGGNNKVEMKKLKTMFESLGFTEVVTYINSGNVIFSDTNHSAAKLAPLIEKAIEAEFGFGVKVLVRDQKNIAAIYKALPKDWSNDENMKCDVMFLWEAVDSPDVLNQLTIKESLDEVRYVAGTVLWSVDRKNVTKSGLMKLVGTKLYAQMTIRNCNTLRKLAQLMEVA